MAKKYALKENADYVVEAEKAKKDTVIKTKQYGDILVTKGNYVMTLPDKTQVGITETDLALFYDIAK